MTKKYAEPEQWDVYLRDSYGEPTQTVRVEGSPSANSGLYLEFTKKFDRKPSDIGGGTYIPTGSTALFPHMNVAKVVRVEEEETKEGPFAQSDNLLAKGTACVSSRCGCR